MLGIPCGSLAQRQLATVWLARGQLARGSGLCLRIFDNEKVLILIVSDRH